MSEFIKQLSADKIIWWGFLLSIGIIVLELLYGIIFYNFLPPVIPLYNQLPWGVERLGGRIELFFPVVLTGGICILNMLLTRILYEKTPFIARMLTVTTLLCTLLTSFFIVRMTQLII